VTLALANGREITISEVYCAKSFSSTYLLSIPQLAKKGAEVRFTSNKVTMLERGHAVATGTLCKRSGLYRLDLQRLVLQQHKRIEPQCLALGTLCWISIGNTATRTIDIFERHKSVSQD
jgi:hypothetical protein